MSGNCLNETVLPLSRMTSEFGWWSFPSLPTWLNALKSNELTLSNPSVLNRIHHPHAIEEVVNQTKYHFAPITYRNDIESFEKFAYFSQVRVVIVVNQALIADCRSSRQCVIGFKLSFIDGIDSALHTTWALFFGTFNFYIIHLVRG